MRPPSADNADAAMGWRWLSAPDVWMLKIELSDTPSDGNFVSAKALAQQLLPDQLLPFTKAGSVRYRA
jgi:hypothetical protein